MTIEQFKRDTFTEEEKHIIEELAEKKMLVGACRDLNSEEFDFYIKRVARKTEKLFKCLSFLVFVVFIFFIILYLDDREGCGFMYPWLFLLCVFTCLYLYFFGHWWTHRYDKKIYERKSVVLKYNTVYSPKGVAWNAYSIAEVMPDGIIRYFGIRGESQRGDNIYEDKLLMADMIREKGQTITMFDIDRKSIHIGGTTV